ncbi:oleate hydratase [Streptomyces triticiradicis]|uniref:Uncharacterized protein n=1 Tax=Streptomyces triticiradicis TaxID=2651189 RepID=A0A7J5DNH4_9ACTN|nr:hypothetical protein F8144_04580 [Streptomyces triticiradicis]
MWTAGPADAWASAGPAVHGDATRYNQYDSNRLLTIVAHRQAVHRDRPEDVSVWWGYGLFSRQAAGTARSSCDGAPSTTLRAPVSAAREKTS